MGEVEPGESVLDAANRLGVGLRSECGGGQACGKCRVIIPDQVGVTPIEAPEAKRLIPDEAAKGYRLACSTRILSSARKVTVIVPPESIQRARRFSDADTRRRVHLDPLVKSYSIPGEPSREALMGELQRRHGLTGLRIDETLRIPSGAESITASILDECEVIALAGGDPRRLGLAVDVGTSRITVSLLDLGDGSTLASLSAENPQIAYGENLITRAAYAQRSDENRLKLKGELLREINALIGELTESNGVHRGDILHAVIVGNTVMHHLFCGVPVEPLTHCPFESPNDGLIVFRASELGWNVPGDPTVRFLPCLGGFVGSDILAGILATRIHESDRLAGLVDLGTNGEIVIGNRERLLCASTAAGPAFEGGRIGMGMRAATGAITEVSVRDAGLQCRVLGHVAPRGICGSGLVDAVAAGLDLGLIRPNGRLAHGKTLPLAGPVALAQADIRELQLAKGATAAGLRILLDRWGAAPAELRCIYLAGAFGNYLNRASARRIGLLDFPPEMVENAGNTALLGAKIALFGDNFDTVRGKVGHIPLGSDPAFQEKYVEAMTFPVG